MVAFAGTLEEPQNNNNSRSMKPAWKTVVDPAKNAENEWLYAYLNGAAGSPDPAQEKLLNVFEALLYMLGQPLVSGDGLEGAEERRNNIISSFKNLYGNYATSSYSNTIHSIDTVRKNVSEKYPDLDLENMEAGEKAATLAKVYIGRSESNSRGWVTEILSDVGCAAHQPWCAAFVSTVLEKVLPQGAFTPTASSKGLMREAIKKGAFQDIGKVTDINDIKVGSVMVRDRGSDLTKGHVGIVVGIKNGKVQMVEGNSADAVRMKEYTLAELRAKRVRGFVETDRLAAMRQYDLGAEVNAKSRETPHNVGEGKLGTRV